MGPIASRSAWCSAGLLLLAVLEVRAAAAPACWKGELEVSTSNFTSSDRRVVFTKLVYDVYQGRGGSVRRELKYSEPRLSKVIGIGRDVHLIDYARGTLIAFDKDKPMALRYASLQGLDRDPFAVPHSRLGSVIILDQPCEGATNRSQSDGRTEFRESWVATESGFRHPLLDIVKAIASPEAARKLGVPEGLLSMTVRMITRIEKVDECDESLFQVPTGYEVVDVIPPGLSP